MLVKERMSSPVITVAPDTPIMNALDLMQSKGIRRAPVMRDGKLVGIVSDKDLLNAAPSDATSLSVWELNYLLSRLRVKEIMSTEVITVNENTPIEEAAYLMAANKIGGLDGIEHPSHDLARHDGRHRPAVLGRPHKQPTEDDEVCRTQPVDAPSNGAVRRSRQREHHAVEAKAAPEEMVEIVGHDQEQGQRPRH